MALTGPCIVLLLSLVIFYRRLAWVAGRREEQYFAAGALFHRALEAVSEAVIITNEDGRIERINHTAEQMFGIGREQAPGHSVLGFLPEGARRFLTAAGRDDLREIGGRRARLVRADGTRFLAAIRSIAEYDVRGQRLRIYFVQDLTELLIRRARDRRDQRMDLFESRRRSSVFAAMTHDLRTPLQIVSGALETISSDELSAEDREHLDMARHASINAIARVEDAITAALHSPLSTSAEHAFDPAGFPELPSVANPGAAAPSGTLRRKVTASPRRKADSARR